MRGDRRWKNLGQAQETIFLSTTVQGFVQAFAEPTVADTLTTGLFEDCIEYGVVLHGFVVMPEHIHLLATLPSTMSASAFANVIKSKAAIRVLSISDRTTLKLLAAKRTLKDRVLWQRSFRSIIIDKEWAFRQKLDYIHNNPVKRKLCERPEQYRWSSAWMFDAGLYGDWGLDLRAGLTHYKASTL